MIFHSKKYIAQMLLDSPSETFPIVVKEFVPGGIDSPPGPQPGQEFLFFGSVSSCVSSWSLMCQQFIGWTPPHIQKRLTQHPCSLPGKGSPKLDGAQVTGLEGFSGLDDLDRLLPKSLLTPKIRIRTLSLYGFINLRLKVMHIGFIITVSSSSSAPFYRYFNKNYFP